MTFCTIKVRYMLKSVLIPQWCCLGNRLCDSHSPGRGTGVALILLSPQCVTIETATRWPIMNNSQKKKKSFG